VAADQIAGESQENKYLRVILDNQSDARLAAGAILNYRPLLYGRSILTPQGVHAPVILIMIPRYGRGVNFVTTKNSAPGSHRRHFASVPLG
jgi:hypothetical protein